MNSLSENTYDEKTLKSNFCFCNEYFVGKALKKANACKTKGTPVIHVFTYLLQLVYTKKSTKDFVPWKFYSERGPKRIPLLINTGTT